MLTRIYLGMPKETPAPGAIQALERTLIEQVGGFTAFAATGAWKGPDGAVMEELAYVYEIAHEENRADGRARWPFIREFALAMKELLRQREVLLVHIPAEKEVL